MAGGKATTGGTQLDGGVEQTEISVIVYSVADKVVDQRMWTTDPVRLVKAEIQGKVGIPPALQDLTIGDRQLADDRMLGDY